MKNFTNNFKQFTSRLSARWLIMALMLLLGTGSIWGAQKALYLDAGGSSLWDQANAKFVAYAWADNVSATWNEATKVGSYYQVMVSDKVTKVIWLRKDPSGYVYNNWTCWNRVGDVTGMDTNNLTTVNGWSESSFKTSYYDDISTYTVSGTDNAVKLSDSDKWVTYTLYKGGTAVSSSDKIGTGSALSWTVTDGGQYTVKGTNTYKTEDMSGSYTYNPCTQSVSEGAGLYSNGDITLSAKFNTCGTAYIGFQWKERNDSWCYDNNADCYVMLGEQNKSNEEVTTTLTKTGGVFVFRPYIVVGNNAQDWLYGDPFEVVTCTPVSATNFTVTNNTYIYDGTAKAATVKWTDNQSAEGITVTYNPTTPKDAGTYDILVTTTAHGDLCASNGAITLGDKLTITQKPPTDADFTYTESKTYTGSALGADVKWVANTGTGAITTYYKKQGAADNTYTTNAPTDAGTYTIAVTTVAKGNYGVVTKLPLDDFEIKKANQTLTISNSTTSLCESEVTLTTSGGPGKGSVSFEITANTAGATINGNTLTATQSGSVTVVATKAADDNYNAATSAAKTFTFTLLSAPTFTPTSATACINTAFNLNDKFTRNDGGAGELEWYTVTGGTKVNNPESVTISETTTYYAKVKEGSCYSANSVNVTVNIYTPGISSITITPSTNSITVKATITGSDLQSMQVEVAEDGDWANAIQGTTAVNGSGSFTCSVNGLQEGTAYKVRVGANTKTCSALFTYADVQEVTTLCNTIAAPAIITEATVCPNTDVALSTFDNGVANVMWYSDPECNSPVTTANISSEKSYYARIKSGICFSEVAQLDLSVYIAPEQPSITPSGTIPVGQGKTATITVENYNANVTYTCYQGVNAVGTWNNNTLSITVGNALGETTYRIVASNPTCPNLTEETSFILDVKEAGAKIAILGSSALYTNDNTHFVPMYVQKEGITDVPGATKVTGFTWEYSANGSTNWAACSTGYQAAGPGMSNGGEKCNNWRANAVGYYRCKITYDVSYQYTNTLQVTSATNSNSNKQHVGATRNLPIISVNTGAKEFPSDCNLNGDYPSKHADEIKAKISVDVKIFNKDGSLYYDRKARMNYRGSSSLNFKKKSYAFVTGKEKTKNEKGDVDTGKENLFGLSNGAKDKDWVLYAATPDPSMMRNRLTFDLYKEMTGKWGVSSMYVELVVNGEYKGVYVLMDKITNNEKRVNITSSNGFIVKFDKTDVVDRVENKEGDQKTFATSRTGTGVDGRHPNGIDSYGTKIDQRFEIEYPEKEDIVDAGGNWTETYTIIKDRFEEFEAALAEKDYPTVRKLIDYDSWADWFIISEYIKNQDTYRASNIFVFNGDKIEAWPLWDQELSFNNQTRTAHGSTSTTGLMATTQSIYEDAFKAVFWLTGGDADDKGGLLGDPCFVALVKSKWEAYKANQLSASNVSTKVTAFGNELGKAQEREQARWPYSGDVRGLTCDGATIGYYGKNEGQAVGYSTSVSAINTWATNRVNGFTSALNAYTTEDLIFGISPETTPATPWQPVILTVSVPEGFEYDIAYPELTAAGAIVTKTKDMYQVKIPRPTGDGWTIGGNGTDKNGQATAQTKTFTVTASITKSTENACGSVNKDKVTSTITLQDVTEACNPEIVKQ